MHVGIQSWRLRALPHLAKLFPEWTIHRVRRVFSCTGKAEALVGWGHKQSGLRSRQLAARRGLPYIALEDGFVRSYDLAVRGAHPWSLVCDTQGIYYDATQPSQLETLIAACRERPEASALMARVREHRISKYNAGRLILAEPLPQPYVLLVDQCAGDASVPLGYADAESFRRMLAIAAERHPDCTLVVKTHPDVISGARQGFLTDLPANSLLIGDDINPYLLVEQAREVHVVTSMLGLEALIAGKKVVCHGVPFYAGWGLTEDTHLPTDVVARRQARPTLLQLFSASYLDYARYLDPWTGAPSTLDATIDHILWLRAQYATRPTRLHATGFSHWKQPHVTPFLLPPGGQITFHADATAAIDAARRDATPLAFWAAKETPQLAAADVPLLRVEDGFLRSTGLGSDLIAAQSLSIDDQGIYFDASRPSRLENILNHHGFDDALLQRAAQLRASIQARALSKYNLGGGVPPSFPAGKKTVLVVGQVEDDASIARGGTAIRSNAALLQAVRQAEPDAWLIYKPHPDVVAGNRKAGSADQHPKRFADQVLPHAALPALLERVDALHTITSLAGFEMLLRGGSVVTWGQPFYAGWGLTDDRAGPFPRRTRTLSLDMLVAATLILYPSYHDWQANLPTTPEHAIEQMASARPSPMGARQLTRLRRWMGL